MVVSAAVARQPSGEDGSGVTFHGCVAAPVQMVNALHFYSEFLPSQSAL